MHYCILNMKSTKNLRLATIIIIVIIIINVMLLSTVLLYLWVVCRNKCKPWSVLSLLLFKGDEELYHRHLQLIHNILTSLTKEDAERGNIGKLDLTSFKRGLQTALPAMTEEDLATVIRAAEMEYDVKDEQDIEYKELFTEVCTNRHCSSSDLFTKVHQKYLKMQLCISGL